MAFPLNTTGSLSPTFVPAPPVGVAVKLQMCIRDRCIRSCHMIQIMFCQQMLLFLYNPRVQIISFLLSFIYYAIIFLFIIFLFIILYVLFFNKTLRCMALRRSHVQCGNMQGEGHLRVCLLYTSLLSVERWHSHLIPPDH